MNWYKISQLSYPLEDPPLYGDSNYKTQGGKIVNMSPDEFLQKVRPLNVDETSQENIDDLKEMMRNEQRIDPPTLYLTNGEIKEHDGRHRAVAAKQLSIKSIPVLIMETEWRNMT
jgi:hypothetical protein